MSYLFTPNPWVNIKIQSPSYLLSESMNSMFTRCGVPEQGLLDWTKQYIQPDSVVLDIGAHIGTYTITLAPLCQQVHSFECQKMTYMALCGNIFINNLTNVTPWNTAIGSEIGTATLNSNSPDGGSSSIKDLPTHTKETIIHSETVKVTTVDTLEFPKVDFMKIDVEGAELDVLMGATETIMRCKPTMMLEVWPDDWYEKKRKLIFNYIEKVLHYKIIDIGNYPYMKLLQPIDKNENPNE